MKKRLIYWLLTILCLSIFCCAQEQIGEDKTIAKINDYALTLDEFQVQLD
jgi:hypothetical protein